MAKTSYKFMMKWIPVSALFVEIFGEHRLLIWNFVGLFEKAPKYHLICEWIRGRNTELAHSALRVGAIYFQFVKHGIVAAFVWWFIKHFSKWGTLSLELFQHWVLVGGFFLKKKKPDYRNQKIQVVVVFLIGLNWQGKNEEINAL